MEAKPSSSELHREFRNQLAQAVLQAERAILKVLAEAFRMIITVDFVKENAWPELIPELRTVFESSNLISQNAHSQWDAINVLTILHTIIRPFQYFQNPKVPREPVPAQLESIAEILLVPLVVTLHHNVEKALSFQYKIQFDLEQVLLMICKCVYFSVKSYMPAALSAILPSFCQDLFQILNSLNLECASPDDGYLLRLKTAKRSLYIFRALVTRHQKHVNKLLPNIFNCAFKLSKQSANIDKLDFPSERIVSLAFDVISHILETGPGWRLVSPHFSSILDSAIFPALIMNSKDVSEWEEDAEEYMRKNLPSELEEISGWAEDLFTARKSAINLLGVIAMSKGPPVVSVSSKRKKGIKANGKERHSSVGELLVIPFLSKFPLPFDGPQALPKTVHDYYGALMAYGGLHDFLIERNPEYTCTLLRNRVLPLYSLSLCSPYLVATANWILGELASCLPEEMNTDIYSSLTKTLSLPDLEDISCYPVRASAVGAIAALLENDYVPSDWQSLLQVLVERVTTTDENESSLIFLLLGNVVDAGKDNIAIHIPFVVSRIADTISKQLPPAPDPWPQVVERGFSALAAMVQTWDESSDEFKEHENSRWRSGCATIAKTFSSLLQQAWIMPIQQKETATTSASPPPSCVDDASALLGFVMRLIVTIDEAAELKIPELLAVWSVLIAEWHAWEEMEDLSIFNCIQEAIDLHRRYDSANFFMRKLPSQGPSHNSTRSIIEGVAAFVRDAITAYPSAIRRACSCVHLLLYTPRFSLETEDVKRSMAASFSEAAFSRFREICNKPCGLSKPLLLVISSCYISYPNIIEQVLEKHEDKGFMIWAHALANVSSSTSEHGLSSESEIKLAVISLAKVVERLLEMSPDGGNATLHECFRSLMEACIHLKEVQDEASDGVENAEEEEEASDEDTDDEEDDDIDDEDSEDDEREETEEEFLSRYAEVAKGLDGEIVAEGDAEEDEVQELELGVLDEVNIQELVVSLIKKHRYSLAQTQIFPPDLVQRILEVFPDYVSLFHA
ncbi:Armadillo-like helical-containing protein [Dioscorea alata]|nr:Armadillo-like helical-containing protein [Dioscorea alata]